MPLPSPLLARRARTQASARAALGVFTAMLTLLAAGGLVQAQPGADVEEHRSPRALFDLAVALDGLGRGPECAAAIDSFLALGPARTTAAQRARLSRIRAAWALRLGTVELVVDPEDAVVAVDEVRLEGSGPSRSFLAAPGERRLRITSEGRRPHEETLSILAGQTVARTVRLEAPAPSGPPVLALRPVDAATVRIVVLLGIDAAPLEGTPLSRARVRLAHGSGVTVRPDGLVVTARHVVENARLMVVFPAASPEPTPARVLALGSTSDLAVLATGRSDARFLPIGPMPPLAIAGRLSASGFPLEVSESTPAAASGELSRVREDGRLQVSIALNPGNSGGPVIDADGRLVGIVSEGADPSRGAQGIALIEPVDRALALVEPLGPTTARPEPLEPHAARALLELMGVRPPADPLATGADTHALDGLERVDPTSRALAVAAAWNALLLAKRARNALRPGSTLPQPAASHAHALERRLSQLARSVLTEDPTARQSMPFLAAVARGGIDPGRFGAPHVGPHVGPRVATSFEPPEVSRCVGDGSCGGGRCDLSTGRCIDLRISDVELLLGAGLIYDQDYATMDAGVVTAMTLIRAVSFGARDPVRFSFVLGPELTVGAWRGNVAWTVAADAGVALDVGTPDVSAVVRALYTFGAVGGEGRTALLYRAYRLMIGVAFGSFGLGLSWREAGREADTTLRTLELYGEVGL